MKHAMDFLSFLSVLLCSFPFVFAQNCQSNSHVNGCSLPFHMEFFYKTKFTPSCNLHDICYHCGVHFGKTKADCDLAFYNNMVHVCNSLTKRFLLSDPIKCKAAALTYYEAVKGFGSLFFKTTADPYCTQTWVHNCI